MYASVWPSDSLPGGAVLRRQRAASRTVITARAYGTCTRIDRLGQDGSVRVRLPHVAGDGLEAVIINTAGGLACGDVFTVEAEAGTQARLTLTTPAAEKVYKSDGDTCRMHVSLRLEAGSHLFWLPQEMILFDRARIARRIEVDMADDARLLMFEALVLGRDAHGETLREGHVSENWRVRRGGKLVYADALRLSGNLESLLARPTVTGGMRALATLLYVAPDAASRLDEVRAVLGDIPTAAASSWNGLLAVRFLAPDIATLRRDAATAITCLSGAGLPRVWRT